MGSVSGQVKLYFPACVDPLLASLGAVDDFTGFEVRSSAEPGEVVTCYDENTVRLIAENLHVRKPFLGVVCDGREFNGDPECKQTECSERDGSRNDYEFWSRPLGDNTHLDCL